MNTVELLDAAKRKTGTFAEVAKRLGVAPARVSEWRKGLFKPDASQIAQIAEMADLPVFETVAAVEMEVHPEAANVWQRALEKLKAAGVAAAVTTLAVGLNMSPQNANASPSQVNGERSTLYIMSTLRCVSDWLNCSDPPDAAAFTKCANDHLKAKKQFEATYQPLKP